MKKMHWLLMLGVISALIVPACAPASVPSGGGQPAPSGAKATESPAAKPTANQPSSGNAAGSAPVADLLELKAVTEGLDSLDSYESTFTMSFKGADSGQPKEWTWTLSEQFVKNPPAKRSLMSSVGHL